jgi:hypothetical protein
MKGPVTVPAKLIRSFTTIMLPEKGQKATIFKLIGRLDTRERRFPCPYRATGAMDFLEMPICSAGFLG